MLFGQIWQTQNRISMISSQWNINTINLVGWNSNHNMPWRLSKLMIESRELCLSCMYMFYSIWHLEHWVSTPWTDNSSILTQKPSTNVRTIFKPLTDWSLIRNMMLYITWMGCYLILNKATYVLQIRNYTTILTVTVQKFMCMHTLFGTKLLIDHFSWYFKLICGHCKFEQMNKTFCDRTHVNRILCIFAVVNFEWVFCLSCATWFRARNDSWWLGFYCKSSDLNLQP